MEMKYNIKIIKRGEIRPEGKSVFSFNAWPTVGKLKDETLLVAYSGNRTRHIDPFGTILGCYSRDEGKTWTNPFILIDTTLDDRDAGVKVLNDGAVIVTSVSNTIAYQRSVADYYDRSKEDTAFCNAYLDLLNEKIDEKTLFPKFIYSKDGYIFDNQIHETPVASPHGPFCDKEGNIYFCGTIYEKGLPQKDLALYKMNKDFSYEKLYQFNGEFCGSSLYEPFGVFLDNGKLIIYFRAQKVANDNYGKGMRIIMAISEDGGRSFSDYQETGIVGGPPHIIQSSSGLLICSYGYRDEPFGQMVAVSRDGIYWDKDYNLDGNSAIFDLGYPSTVELSKNRFMTVYYQSNDKSNKQGVKYTIWEIDTKEK